MIFVLLKGKSGILEMHDNICIFYKQNEAE